MPTITLPDGSRREFDRPVTVQEVAASIGPGLAKAALAGRLNGDVVDSARLIEDDAQLILITHGTANAFQIGIIGLRFRNGLS